MIKMKMIKKLLVAVLAMAMVLGTMVIPASAAEEYEVTVTVEWAAAEEEVSLWIWGTEAVGLNYTESGAWPGDALTKNDDGTWSGTFTVGESTVGLILTCDGEAGRTSETQKVDATKGAINIKVLDETEEIDDFGTMKTVNMVEITTPDAPAADAPAEDTPAGDSTAVMGYVVAAVVALAAVVTVVSKKRSVEA